MKLHRSLALTIVFLVCLASAIEQDRTVDVFAWPLSAAKSSTLANIKYNSTAATVQSYHALSIPTPDEIVRVGFYHPTGSWSGVATSASNFADAKHKRLQLHLNRDGVLYHVGFMTSESGGRHGTSKGSEKDGFSVEVVAMRQGPTPHLNRPVVMNADGSPQEKEPEKSFLQKYWWVIAGFLLLQVVLSAGKAE